MTLVQRMASTSTMLRPLLAASAPGEGASLRVGAARFDLTPAADPAIHPRAYAHEKLYLRAIVLDNGVDRAAFIGADLGVPSKRWTRPPRYRSPRSAYCPVETSSSR